MPGYKKDEPSSPAFVGKGICCWGGIMIDISTTEAGIFCADSHQESGSHRVI
jgi:hypothetical protein